MGVKLPRRDTSRSV